MHHESKKDKKNRLARLVFESETLELTRHTTPPASTRLLKQCKHTFHPPKFTHDTEPNSTQKPRSKRVPGGGAKDDLHSWYQVQWLVHFMLTLCVFTQTAPAPSLLSQLSDLSNHGLSLYVLDDYSRSRRADQYRARHYPHGRQRK